MDVLADELAVAPREQRVPGRRAQEREQRSLRRRRRPGAARHHVKALQAHAAVAGEDGRGAGLLRQFVHHRQQPAFAHQPRLRPGAEHRDADRGLIGAAIGAPAQIAERLHVAEQLGSAGLRIAVAPRDIHHAGVGMPRVEIFEHLEHALRRLDRFGFQRTGASIPPVEWKASGFLDDSFMRPGRQTVDS
ncbi:MAG: hypothetical protein WDN44_03810 [Sphingomonas sp.]